MILIALLYETLGLKYLDFLIQFRIYKCTFDINIESFPTMSGGDTEENLNG